MSRRALSVRLPEELHEEALFLSKILNVSVNTMISDSLSVYIKKHRPDRTVHVAVDGAGSGKEYTVSLFILQDGQLNYLGAERCRGSNGYNPAVVKLRKRFNLENEHINVLESKAWRDQIKRSSNGSKKKSGSSKRGCSARGKASSKKSTSSSAQLAKSTRSRSRSRKKQS